MKTIQWIALIIALLSTSVATQARPLTNSDIVAMIKGGVPESTIVLSIQTSPSQFDKSPEALIALSSAGATQRILNVMFAPKSQAEPMPPVNVTCPELLRQLSEGSPAADETDTPYVGLGGRVATVLPAGFTVLNLSDDQMNIVSPSKDLIFVVSCVSTGLFSRSLGAMTEEMVNSVPSQFPGAEVSTVLSTSLSGVGGREFTAKITVNGEVKMRAFVFTVIGRRLIAVSMYAPPDKASYGVGIVKRVCTALRFTGK